MYIDFDRKNMRFMLNTDNTAYIFEIVGGKFPVHRYYGKKIDRPEFMKAKYHSFSPYQFCTDTYFSVADEFMEFPLFGSGDFRCTALKLRGINGDCCTQFIYSGYSIKNGRTEIPGMPFARPEKNSETLELYMRDELNSCTLTLYYTVFPECDIISRSFSLINEGKMAVKIEKAMSLSLDLAGHEFDLISLHGKHMMECMMQRTPLFYGNQSIMSRRGASSHQFNPFIALALSGADEEHGDIYAFNLVYSGNFLDEVEVDHAGNTRVAIGIGSENFGMRLEENEEFFSPEAIMLYTENGLGEMSRKMHAFVRGCISPPEICQNRPVVLNTWEACHFKIDEQLLLDFADEAKKCGIDMIVVDDGWFGERCDDRRGLGDWYVNSEKFPSGLRDFAEKIKDKGLKFGIWIEPEMISPDSGLYRAHPEWCLGCTGRELSLSRSQLVLDLCNPEVVKYLKETFAGIFDGVPIDYIKWDFNRHLSEVGSYALPYDRQDEAAHRYMLGVYELYRFFINHFAGVMIENCSGGGGRYDLAMMALSSQIWTSDNTSPSARMKIQYGSSLAYPASVMSCHVSDPGNSENEMRLLDFRYKTALGGILGYEMNILKKSVQVRKEILEQIKFYRMVEDIIKTGDMYRLISPFENTSEISSYYYAKSGGSRTERILFSFLQRNRDEKKTLYLLRIAAADGAYYREYFSGKVYSGEELRSGICINASAEDASGQIMLFELTDKA